MRAMRQHRGSKWTRVRDVKDIPDEEKTVVDKVDLGMGQLLQVDDPVCPFVPVEQGADFVMTILAIGIAMSVVFAGE